MSRRRFVRRRFVCASTKYSQAQDIEDQTARPDTSGLMDRGQVIRTKYSKAQGERTRQENQIQPHSNIEDRQENHIQPGSRIEDKKGGQIQPRLKN